MTPAPINDRFPSFLALREAHAALLDQEEAEPLTALRPAILNFVARAEATGALLDVEADRRAAQSLLSYWTTQLYRSGDLTTRAVLAPFDPALAPELPNEPQPYRGLAEFAEADQALFFGREAQVADCVRRLATERLLAVLGPSGSGKSSLVRAGLISALKAGALPGSAAWGYPPPLVPGSSPMAALTRLLSAAMGEGDQPWVVVVDQFEEVFTLADRAEGEAFAARLLAFVRAPGARHRLIITLRSDFETKLATLPELQTALLPAIERVRPLTGAELRRAIEEPAARVGLKFEEGVVTALMEDVLGEPAALPLLQFTLQQLWERRERNRVTRAVYRELGGGRQALQNAADRFFEKGLLPEEREVARQIFLRLVRPGEGLEVTSQRLRRVELFGKAYNTELTNRVLDKLVREARLLKQTQGEAPEDTQVEVAHEALVRNWPTLVGWLEDERENVRARNRLRDQARRWQAERDPSLLWRGRELERAEAYDDLSELEGGFVQASRAEAERAEREKEAARQKELADARQLAHTERRAAQLSRWVSGVALFALVLVGVAIWFLAQASANETRAQAALQQQQLVETASTQQASLLALAQTAEAEAVQAKAQALTQQAAAEAASTQAVLDRATAEAASTQAVRSQVEAQSALSRQLAAQARALLKTQPRFALLLGLEAFRVYSTTEASLVLSEATTTLLTRTVEAFGNPLPLERNSISSLAFSPDGQWLAGSLPNGTVVIWDVATQSVYRRFEPRLDSPGTVAFSADGTRVIVCGGQLDNLGELRARAQIWEVETRQSFPVVDLSLGPCNAARLSADGNQLAMARDSSEGVIWDLARAAIARKLPGGHVDSIFALDWSPADSDLLATGGRDGRVRVWDVSTGELVVTPANSLFSRGIASVRWSPDGQRLAASTSGVVKLLEARTGAEQLAFPVTGVVDEVDFSPDGRWLAGALRTGALILWDLDLGAEQIRWLAPREVELFSLAYSPLEDLIAVGDSRGQAHLLRFRTPPTAKDPLTLACELVDRNLSEDEWKTYLPGTPYRKTCPNLP